MSLSNRLEYIQGLMNQTMQRCHRTAEEVMLLAVSKQQSADTIAQAYNLGIVNFGENYYQEALSKIAALQSLPIQWHFIGPLQSNKTKGIAEHFDWVHSVDRLKTAKLLNQHRPSHLPPLNICLQINLLDETTKSGIAPTEAGELASAIGELPHLKLRGLMLIPPPMKNPEDQYNVFMHCHQLKNQLNQQVAIEMDTLSMGMSEDLIPAIQAGSTIIRIGRAIFGERH